MSNLNRWIQRTSVRIAISFVWILVIFGVYYWGHKPFDTAWVLGTISFLAPAVVALLWLLSAGLLGQRILPRLDTPPSLSTPVLQILLGGGIFSLIILLVGLTIGVSTWISWGLLLLVFALHIRRIPAWFRQWRDGLAAHRHLQPFETWLVIGLGILITLSMLTTWLPISHFDALMYHVMLPKAYLLQGKISDLPWQIQSGMPQNGEMLYLWGLTLLNEAAALWIVWLLGVSALLGWAAFLTEQFDFRSALVGMAAFLCGYTLISSLTWGYVDWVTFFFSTGMLLAFFTWLLHQKTEWLVVAGVMGGLLLGSKYTSGGILVCVEVAITVYCLRTRKAWWQYILAYNLPLLLVFSPWLIKNFAFTGNPIYPLFFVSGTMTPIRIDTYQTAGAYGNWLDIVFLPFMATLNGYQGTDLYGSTIGPLLLALGMLLWVGWQHFQPRQKMLLKTVLWMAATGVIVWVVANRMSGFLVQTRMHYALFPLFILLAAAGFRSIQKLDTLELRFSRIVQAAILLALAFNVIQFGQTVLEPTTLSYLDGGSTRDEYLDTTLGWYMPAMRTIKAMPADTHTLLLYETRSYHCLPNCQPDEILDRWKRDWQTYGDSQAILDAWRAEGITHVLVYESGIKFVIENWTTDANRETLAGLQNFLDELPAPLEKFGTTYALYDIR